MSARFVVRVVLYPDQHEPLVEALAEVGLAQLHTETCFDLLPPAGVEDSNAWAARAAADLEARGYNAVKAPAWPTDAPAGPLDEACPGCGCEPGDGRTPGCIEPSGCGYEDER